MKPAASIRKRRASNGGKARALKLSPARRSEIGKIAAAQRWSLPQTTPGEAETAPPLRAPGVVVRALTIDRYAYTLLREMAPTTKSYGHFISALVLAEYARRQERLQRLSDLPKLSVQE